MPTTEFTTEPTGRSPIEKPDGSLTSAPTPTVQPSLAGGSSGVPESAERNGDAKAMRRERQARVRGG